MQKQVKKLVVAISSRALFDLEESHRVYTEQGLDAYTQYQIDQEDNVLAPGVAFGLVKKLLHLNRDAEKKADSKADSKADNKVGSNTDSNTDSKSDAPRVEVILLSRNNADTGLRVFNTIQHYDLAISRAAFTNGAPPWRYVAPFAADLFLSADPGDVQAALRAGFAAATIVPSHTEFNEDNQLRIAFDGDAVLFSDEAERIFKTRGLTAFAASEQASARKPLSGGPFKNFLTALHQLQSEYPPENSPIRTALVTARSAPAHERVIRTMRAWNIRIDEALFLGGMPKAEFLRSFGADIFFDDQQGHVEAAARHVATGHVPHGVANE